ALRTRRHFVGFDADAGYASLAGERIEEERARLSREADSPEASLRVRLHAGTTGSKGGDAEARPISEGAREGLQAKELAGILLQECGFSDIRSDVSVPGAGIELAFVARDQTGGDWAFEVCGGFTAGPNGLRRTDVLWKELGKAAVLCARRGDLPLVLMATHLPPRASAGRLALNALTGPGQPVFDVVQLLSGTDEDRLRGYAVAGGGGGRKGRAMCARPEGALASPDGLSWPDV
ncbi:MAG: hypothetical protein ACRDZP_03590, partial [Acidimicrobiales bacterium]